MNRFKIFSALALTMALLALSIPSTFAVTDTAEVDFVVRGTDSIGVENAEVYVYVLNEDEGVYELYSGPHITADAAGRANNVPIPIGATFFGVAYDEDDNVYADSNYTYENIWTVIDADHIQNIETGSTRLAYVHMYPGLYEAIEPTFADPDATPDPASDPASTGDPTPDDTSTGDPASSDAPGSPDASDPILAADVTAAPSYEVEVTVYDEFRNPIEDAKVYLYVTDFGIYSEDTTDGAGRTQAITAPIGYEFYAIATTEAGGTYGGTYDFYFDRPNYWTSADGETIENVSTGLIRIPYLHLYPEEFVSTVAAEDAGGEAAFDPSTYECGGFPDAIYDHLTPEECVAIAYVHDEGIFTGTDAGLLEWNRPINRAEVTKVMLEAFDVPAPMTAGPSKIFPDVPLVGEWYSNYVYDALASDIVGGYPDGYFRPANTINRVELLRIFIEASGVSLASTPTTFTFWHDVAVNADTQWFIGYGNYAFFNDLLDNDGNLYPAEPMTRMDVIRLLYRASLT